ncbi:MAG: hypothetical protein OEW62_10025 [Candidatus Bathyarchaeota archaeon]|nr:hypothetical protein [Candidatus Bathyarchaeota archaeon]
MLASILAAANIVKENPARRVLEYAFAVGILLLIVSIITFCWIIVSTSSTPHLTRGKDSAVHSVWNVGIGISMSLSVPSLSVSSSSPTSSLFSLF